MNNHLLNRLKSLTSLGKIPKKELEWLVQHGKYEEHDVGLLSPKGFRIHYFWIILSGHITIIVDRGTGPKMVTEWQKGQVIGLLPYSRMSASPGDTYIEKKAEALAIYEEVFPQMIKSCPAFTAFCVHSMLDRVRIFNTSDLQDEKMISLGRLASGLAHELNNPASVTVRDAKMVRSSLNKLNTAWRTLSKAGLEDSQYSKIETILTSCLNKSGMQALSPVERADHQDKITNWLIKNNLDSELALSLSDTYIYIDDLEQIAKIVTAETLNAVLHWIVVNCTLNTLTIDMENSAEQIYKLVNIVKKFTYMDNLAESEFLDVREGIQDTIRVLDSKIKQKKGNIKLEIDDNLPHVHANGSELNQVWLSLLDNALDAISPSGNIHIIARYENNRIIICITDDGVGIPDNALPKIFDPFFTSKPPGQGTGLGLDLARRLLRRYKGDISVRSKPGKTEFQVSLIAGTAQPVKQ